MSRLSRPTFFRAVALAFLVGEFSAGVAQAASPSKAPEVPKLTVYRRARCEKANFGTQDPCTALVQWLDSWHIKYDLRDISRVPSFGLALNQRCLIKKISCSESPIIDDGKSILMGATLAREMERWALIQDAPRVDSDKAMRRDIVPEILAKDAPATPITPETNNNNNNSRRRQKATEED